MAGKKIEQLILEVETYLECWKQFSHFLNLARDKQFTREDESQFLELKSVLAQELEMLLAAFEGSLPGKEDVHALLNQAPSLRFLSGLDENSLRTLENRWHQTFISWQSILGQLKVQQRQLQSRSLLARLSGRDQP